MRLPPLSTAATQCPRNWSPVRTCRQRCGAAGLKYQADFPVREAHAVDQCRILDLQNFIRARSQACDGFGNGVCTASASAIVEQGALTISPRRQASRKAGEPTGATPTMRVDGL